MWNKDRKHRRGRYSSQLARRLFVRFLAGMAGVVLIVVMLVSLWRVVHSFAEPYRLLPAGDRSGFLDWMFSTMEAMLTGRRPIILIAGALLAGPTP